tara:strand:- start:1158 stop:1706 length:549 start_codon:yes stop_codon:yes gene_type:complete
LENNIDNYEIECVNQVMEQLNFEEIGLDGVTSKDVICIIKKACSTFMNCLTKEEICTCSLNGLWKAITKYEIGSKCKFTTYLYKGVVMECLTQRKFNNSANSKSPHYQVHDNIPSEINPFSSIDMLDEINSKCQDPDIIYDKFYKNMSIKEIAKNKGVCGETIRIKIKKNIEKLHKSMIEGV